MTNQLTKEQLGTIVNELTEDQEKEELEKRIELLEMSRINLRVSPAVFDRLNKQAEFQGLTIEEFCTGILEDSLKTQVGKATITGPSVLSGVAQKKITGPSFNSSISRG